MKPRGRLTRKKKWEPPRKPMKRTAIARGTYQLKRSRLRPVSAKTKALNDANKPLLDEYRRLFPKCQWCGRRNATDIHEIVGGPVRQLARRRRSCILHLCRVCHETLQTAPKRVALACKAATDPLGFDIAEVNETAGRVVATMKEVDEQLDLLNERKPR